MLDFEGAPSSVAPPSMKERVLLVDDDPVVLEAVASMLRPSYHVECALDAEHAWEMLQETTSWSSVICDLGLPDMSGIDLLMRIKEKDRDLPVIVLTGDSSLDSAVRVMECSGFRYITKSISNEAVLDAVRAACATRRIDLLRRRAFDLCRASGWDEQGDDKLARSLSRAMKNLYMVFQPIVSADSGELFGYEALLRSRGPELTNPGVIFDAAESLGRVRDLGRITRRVVAGAFDRAPQGAAMFVNLHPIELTDDELFSPDSPLSMYAKHVVLEITERTSLSAVPELSKRICQLRELGYRLAVDDLGSGYAGLSSFSEIKPDVAKLDMSLIRGIDTCRRRQSIVRSMLQVCQQELATRVVCEGVETPEEYRVLCQLGADLLQGYLIARPLEEFVVPAFGPAKLAG
jgi:EAL domain-containing protein (putative c-di-GMP-specific phosphodiesterase class I)/CheY-like chemotaxis protein